MICNETFTSKLNDFQKNIVFGIKIVKKNLKLPFSFNEIKNNETI
jgi:hypothetical protein